MEIKLPEHTITKSDISFLNDYPEIITFIQENKMDEKMIQRNLVTLKKWADSLSFCKGCKGLKSCRQDNQGLHFECSNAKLMMLSLTACNYKKTLNNELKHLDNYRINHLPEKWQALKLSSLDLSNEPISYKKVVAKALNYLDDPTAKGLYLCGNVGVGKSMLSALVCNDFAANGKKVCYVNVPEMCQKIKTLFQDDEYDRQIYWMKNAAFVVFDDIGAESGSAWVRDELLFPILNYRMENNLATWFTSNEDFDSLYDHYKHCSNIADDVKALRIMERIKSLSELVKFDGKNRRN